MSDIKLKKIEICGFRGFTSRQEIALGTPLTLFHGGNRSGKSSVLNAIEWCLFGPEVAVIKYGDIRERDGWEVKNLHSPACYVQCQFEGDDGKKLNVKRTYKTPKTTDFFCEVVGGEKSIDDTKLHALLQISPTDFVSSVHLHPEVVRSLIVAKPKDRKEAIDRLLGLSELRDMVDAFASEKPSGWTETLDQGITLLDGKLVTALAEKQRIIDNESAELMTKGIKEADLTADGALSYAATLCEELQQVAKEFHLGAPAVTTPSTFAEIQKLRTDVPGALQKLRNEHPVLADQGKHLIRKNNLEGVRSAYVSQLENVSKAEIALTSYPDKRSTDQLNAEVSSLRAEIAKIDAEMKEISNNCTVLTSALEYFQGRNDSEQLSCPLCGETSHTVADWRAHIKKEFETKNVDLLQERKQTLAESIAALEKAQLDIAALQKRISKENSTLTDNREAVEKTIGKVLAPVDDPVAILDAEILRVEVMLNSLQQQVKTINDKFDRFQQAVVDLDRFQRIGRAQQEMMQIDQIEANEAYRELKAIRSECERYAEDVELLIDGLKKAVMAEAEQRLAAAQSSISDTFTKLTNRPDFPGLRVAVVGDGYAIELTNDSGAIKAVPVLNHADINCCALSIFLALAGSSQISHRLGVVILDDPSQSLDSLCKGNLCKVLADLCDLRQVIVATADDELGNEVRKMTKNKVVYELKNWTPSGGPVVQ
jgi:exonuclease SbcC